MTHTVLLSEDSNLVGKEDRVVLDCASSSPGSLALSFSLLCQDLIDSLQMSTSKYHWTLQVRKSVLDRDVRIHWRDKDKIELTLGRTELEYWQVFFLKYYRDGFAEVDHLDLEGNLDNGNTCDFTLKVASAAQPVSEAEARRRLGIT